MTKQKFIGIAAIAAGIISIVVFKDATFAVIAIVAGSYLAGTRQSFV